MMTVHILRVAQECKCFRRERGYLRKGGPERKFAGKESGVCKVSGHDDDQVAVLKKVGGS